MNTARFRSSCSDAGTPPAPRFGLLRAHLPSRLLALFAITLSLSHPVHAQQARPTEQQVKAAYLFNFGKFVRWPVDRSPSPDTIEMCVLGKDPFGAILDSTVAGETIAGRAIKVRRLLRAQDMASCNILFVSLSETNQLGPILKIAQQSGTLTVSDIPHFAEHGGVIGFVTLQGRIRFEVNRDAAERSRLILSSELLKVASQVIAKSTPPSGSQP
jgi:hypothetical protein